MIPENPIDYLTSALKELKHEHAKKLRNQGMGYGSDKLQRKAEKLICKYEHYIDVMKDNKPQPEEKPVAQSVRFINRLEKARKLYPTGTRLTSIWNGRDIVTAKDERDWYIEEDGSVYVKCKIEDRCIYCEGEWAKINK